MRCEQVRPYLPGYAGGELRAETIAAVGGHLSGCAPCRSEAAALDRVRSALASMTAYEVEAPAFLAESVIEAVHERQGRRLVPMLPIPPLDVLRVVQEHRDAIVSAAGTAVVAAGAGYALWRAVRGVKPARAATS